MPGSRERCQSRAHLTLHSRRLKANAEHARHQANSSLFGVCFDASFANLRAVNIPSVLLSNAGGVAEITLNRPNKLNSFNRAMHAELRAALMEVNNDGSTRVILLTGAGRGFCACQDLDDIVDPATGAPGTVSKTSMEDTTP